MTLQDAETTISTLMAKTCIAAFDIAEVYLTQNDSMPANINAIINDTYAALLSKYNLYHDEFGRFTFAPGRGNNSIGGALGKPKIPRRSNVTVVSRSKIIIHHSDGSSEVRMGGDRNWRNNNPGNLDYHAFAKRHGAIGQAGRFAVFPTMAAGYAASEALLNSPSYRFLTVSQALAKRSPPNENSTRRLQKEISSRASVPGSKALHRLSVGERRRLLAAIHWFEGHREGIVLNLPAR